MDANEEEDMVGEMIKKEEVYRIVGAAMEVINELGGGYTEPIYQEAMEIELGMRGIPHQPQRELKIRYKGSVLKRHYCADVICFECVLVELKAMERLTKREMAQVLNYLKATGIEVAVLINFPPDGKLEWRRIVRSAGTAQFEGVPDPDFME
jgi:GxxExxY protein